MEDEARLKIIDCVIQTKNDLLNITNQLPS